jgi:hypothetical protein
MTPQPTNFSFFRPHHQAVGWVGVSSCSLHAASDMLTTLVEQEGALLRQRSLELTRLGIIRTSLHRVCLVGYIGWWHGGLMKWTDPMVDEVFISVNDL